MVPAEVTDSVDNLIHLLQKFSVYEAVEFLEVGFDGCVNEATRFVIGIEQHLQDTFRIVGIVCLLGDEKGFEGSHKLIHKLTVLAIDCINSEKGADDCLLLRALFAFQPLGRCLYRFQECLLHTGQLAAVKLLVLLVLLLGLLLRQRMRHLAGIL